MAASKIFNVQDLYPEDYSFDYETFQADPEGYQFTADDIAYLNAMELLRFEEKEPMTSYERRLLRKWVASGHSPYENPGSRYVPLSEGGTHDFLSVYRMDREIQKAMRGMSKEEQMSYLKEYIGWPDKDKPLQV